jgi:hypothetical protein
MRELSRRMVLLFLFILLPASCSNAQEVAPTPTETSAPVTATTRTVTSTSAPTQLSFATFTPQPRFPSITRGPELEDFPSGVNPLTGRTVSDPSLLGFPAVLVSISNMPASARPQAGPGFAPWLFELFIGEGATRFMSVFYGDYPRPVSNVTGGCKVREEIMDPNGNWIGNRVWLDENEDGVQDDWEVGVGGVCVRLLNGTSREVLKETTTDSNGYYVFENPGGDVVIQFIKPAHYEFTQADVGDDDRDSDADRTTAETKIFDADSTASHWDAGLILTSEPSPAPTAAVTGTPPNWYIPAEPYVGPIRSGRLTYNQIGRMFPNSCLVYASAAGDIGERLDACEIVYGVDRTTPNSALLTVSRLRELAEASLNPRQPVNYSGNLFSEEVPEGGRTADTIHVYYHSYNQAAWRYDPVSQKYLRYTDDADGKGSLHPATERLTGRQLAFENVIVIFADHNRFRHGQFEVNFRLGQRQFAYLFRDGQAFRIYWTTTNGDWERTTGLRRPMHFVDAQNNPVPLHPGRTWIHIVTQFSAVTDEGKGKWLVKFVPPLDPPDTPVP